MEHSMNTPWYARNNNIGTDRLLEYLQHITPIVCLQHGKGGWPSDIKTIKTFGTTFVSKSSNNLVYELTMAENYRMTRLPDRVIQYGTEEKLLYG